MSIGAVTTGSSFSRGYTPAQCRACGGQEESAGGQKDATADKKTAGVTEKNAAKELSKEEQKQLSDLKKRDAEVRAHEAAHMGAGGGVVRGGATYSYQSGPDGQRYAVGGEVGIDTSPVKGNPRATIQKMQQVRAAALAPASPSGQDRSVAAAAAAVQSSAQQQLAAESKDPAPGREEKHGAVEKKEAAPVIGYSNRGGKTTDDSTAGSAVFDVKA